jgi:C-terminal processing protease CtpA/Prc
MKHLLTGILCMAIVAADAQWLTTKQVHEDFDYFWSSIQADYCYFDKKKIDWQEVKNIYQPQLDTITGRNSFVLLLEKLFRELYDNHASLGTNTQESQRLVPTGADLWVEYLGGKPMILEVRLGTGAAAAGISAGMEVVAFNDQPIEQAVHPFLPVTLKERDVAAGNYALQTVLAGNHLQKRKLTLRYNGKDRDFFPDDPVISINVLKDSGLLESKMLAGKIGYIKINNSLGDNNLITQFDSVLNGLMGTKALILDLRETPSGGNTTVARAILSRFISKEGFFQKHELTAEERMFGVKRSWLEIVSPRSKPYTKPLVILADHWTGSVSEAITIGFDALKRGKIIGTELARLNGAVYSYQMPASKIGFNFPVEKLFQVNGKPREDFEPFIKVDLSDQKKGEDKILKTALQFLNR